MDGCEYGNETWLMYEDGGGVAWEQLSASQFLSPLYEGNYLAVSMWGR